MHRLIRLCVLSVVLMAMLGTASPGRVFAHTGRTVAGKYDVEVGWDQEPAYVDQLNGAAIQIYRTGTQTAVEGVEKTLRVQIAFGGGTGKEFTLHRVVGKKGYYVADIIPTRAGDYIFTFVGDIEGNAVNEKFESGPGRFDSVAATDALEFPQAPPSRFELQTNLDAARADASSARLFGIIGIVAGVLGVLVGGATLMSGRQKK